MVGRGLKEPFCALSHLVGIVLSLVATLVLMVAAAGRPSHLVGFALFGASLVTLYTASTLYHALRVPRHHVARLRRFDYVAIFLLIAGTFAPVCLVPLRGIWGWSLLAAEYSLALIGILGVMLLRGRLPEWVRVGLCVCMGWLVLVALAPLRSALPPEALAWLLAGGVIYSLGTVILATDRPHLWPGRFSAHDLWHLFVLGGSACHFVLMVRFIAPL
jgi:hemolysin III